MTNRESRNPVGLDELASWDDAQARDYEEDSVRQGHSRQLTVYGFDSEKRTLVGLGPVERASRARDAADAPDSQRMPPSEPPGPFIADDDVDDEAPRALRQRKLNARTLAAPAVLLVAAAALLLWRGGPAPAPAMGKLTAAAAALQLAARAPLQPPGAVMAKHEDATERAEEGGGEEQQADRLETSGDEAKETAPQGGARLESAASAAPNAPALPVKLADVPTPAIVDWSSGASKRAGIINVTSSPPANVVLDGRPLGKAPRAVRVPPGIHTVVFIHPLYGRRSLSVDVRPGMSTGASAEF
jgi:hypothetical protein